MTGILEQLIAELQRNTAALLGNAPPVGQAATGLQQAAAQPAQQAAAAVTGVTSDAIMALIQPHIGNEATKAALGAAMRSMGINALPEAQPHQFDALYAAFQRVIGAQAAAPAASTSII